MERRTLEYVWNLHQEKTSKLKKNILYAIAIVAGLFFVAAPLALVSGNSSVSESGTFKVIEITIVESVVMAVAVGLAVFAGRRFRRY